MKIKISNLPEGIHELELSKLVKELNLEKPFKNKLNLDCKVDKSAHQIVINCNLTVDADFICDRCNEQYSEELHQEFRLVYLFEKSTDEIKDTNVKFISRTVEELNLTQDAIDFAYLSIPMKKLCDKDCLGLCSSCGINLNKENCNCKNENINPVWEKLLSLKDNLN
jgi:uncharacterized protein